MSVDLLRGALVRLAAVDVESNAALIAHWSADSEYGRLFDSDPARPLSPAQIKAHLEELVSGSQDYLFLIRTLADDRSIGTAELDGIAWTHRDCWLGIGLGDRDYWGRGYGTDAIRVLLRFAFMELNLHRVTLNVFEYNTRALRAYAKVGFAVEGRTREALLREGRRWDLIHMGLLRAEWEAANLAPAGP